MARGMLGYVTPLLLAYDSTHTDTLSSTAGEAHLQQQQLQQQLPSADDAAAVLRLPLLRVNAQVSAHQVRAAWCLAARNVFGLFREDREDRQGCWPRDRTCSRSRISGGPSSITCLD